MQRKQDDDVADFGQRIPYLIRRAHTELSHRLDRDLRAFGLTQAQLSAMAILDHDHPTPLSGAELSQRSAVTAPSMSAALTGLEERGLVTRRPHPTHGRIVEVHVTEAGRTLVREVQVTTKAVEDRDMGGLSEAEQEQLRVLLRRLVGGLGAYLPD
jgi:DNA-binding MarR family transcriptional regulator